MRSAGLGGGGLGCVGPVISTRSLDSTVMSCLPARIHQVLELIGAPPELPALGLAGHLVLRSVFCLVSLPDPSFDMWVQWPSAALLAPSS